MRCSHGCVRKILRANGSLRSSSLLSTYLMKGNFERARATRYLLLCLARMSLEKKSLPSKRFLNTFPNHCDFERVVLDLPEPWKTVPHLPACMVPGGILVAYTPSITQATRLRESLNSTDFVMQETFEVSRRTWHIEGQAVRPEHRMVGHTGFITQARFVGSS